MNNKTESIENVRTADNEKTVSSGGSWTGRIIIIALFVIAFAVYFLVPSVHTWINDVVLMFKSGDFDQMHAFIAKYGKWAMLVSTLLMIFQSIAAPLPAFFITLTNANLFGWWQGCILSWVSSMMGATLCFYIARILGRDVVEKICTKGALASIENFFAKYGKKCIFIARLLPFISFDVVSYAAGLTAMDFWGFFAATGLGQLPACIVYSYVGGMLTGGAKKLFVGLLCLFALAIVVIVIKQAYNASEKKKEAMALENGETYVKEPSNLARFVSKLYNSALWGMIIALVWAKIPALASSLNSGWILIGGWLLGFGISLVFRKKLQCGVKFTAANVVASMAVIFLLCGSAVVRTPAGLLRMGLGIRTVPFATINTIYLAFLAVGFVAVILLWTRQKKTENND